mmetsp:Transcript_4885/g.11511  ORF Transcript_4885/g.11511 Transcript_4885/m.11511 type:complete len:85 (+) Transcript_4885:3477-3731(+)
MRSAEVEGSTVGTCEGDGVGLKLAVGAKVLVGSGVGIGEKVGAGVNLGLKQISKPTSVTDPSEKNSMYDPVKTSVPTGGPYKPE